MNERPTAEQVAAAEMEQCSVEGCDLPFLHEPDGPEHRPACGCFYNSSGDYGLCRDHDAGLEINKEAK